MRIIFYFQNFSISSVKDWLESTSQLNNIEDTTRTTRNVLNNLDSNTKSLDELTDLNCAKTIDVVPTTDLDGTKTNDVAPTNAEVVQDTATPASNTLVGLRSRYTR